jgi:hypothetical protein
MVLLSDLKNEAVVKNLKDRYFSDLIYTYIGMSGNDVQRECAAGGPRYGKLAHAGQYQDQRFRLILGGIAFVYLIIVDGAISQRPSLFKIVSLRSQPVWYWYSSPVSYAVTNVPQPARRPGADQREPVQEDVRRGA